MLGGMVAIKEFFFKDCCEREEGTTSVVVPTKSNTELVDRFKQKFMKEARTIFALSHPNIVSIHDLFEENGTAYYVMEYIKGESLNDIVKEKGKLSLPNALLYINKVAEALKYLHSKNIAHLDIKPSNLMVRIEDNDIRVIDFGLSKQYDGETGGQTSTTPVGISTGYAPIEQYRQGGVSIFSPQTDIYSLAATLFKLITGNTPPEPMSILDEGLPELPIDIPQNICDAIEKGMEVKKNKRSATVDEWKNGKSINFKGTNGENIEIPVCGRYYDNEPDQLHETAFYWAAPNKYENKLWFTRMTENDASANNIIARTKDNIAMSIRLVQDK